MPKHKKVVQKRVMEIASVSLSMPAMCVSGATIVNKVSFPKSVNKLTVLVKLAVLNLDITSTNRFALLAESDALTEVSNSREEISCQNTNTSLNVCAKAFVPKNYDQTVSKYTNVDKNAECSNINKNNIEKSQVKEFKHSNNWDVKVDVMGNEKVHEQRCKTARQIH